MAGTIANQYPKEYRAIVIVLRPNRGPKSATSEGIEQLNRLNPTIVHAAAEKLRPKSNGASVPVAKHAMVAFILNLCIQSQNLGGVVKIIEIGLTTT